MFKIFHPPKFCKAKIVAGKSFKKNGFTHTPERAPAPSVPKRKVCARLVCGFTLVEILVVLVVTVIISTVFLANYKLGQQQFILLRVSYKLAQDVRRVQSMAGLTELSCKKFDNEFHPDYKYGYGINFKMSEETQYLLFADCDGNEKYSGNDELMETVDIDIELLGFEIGAKIKDLKIDDSSVSKLSIVFSPPDPSVFIKSGSDGDLAEIIITLREDITSARSIIVNKAGLIDIN